MSFQSTELETQFIPNKDRREPKSILLLVHGRGGRWPLMKWFSKRAESIAGLDFLCVQAPHPEFVPEMKVPGFSWYIGPDREGLEESRKKLVSLVSELQAESYASENIYWLGFSQGGVMGVDLALRGATRLGGVVCVSGFCLQPESYPAAFGKAALDQKILATHGKRDPIVDFDHAKSSFEHLQSLGVDLKFSEYDKPHSFEMKNEIPDLIAQLQKWTQA